MVHGILILGQVAGEHEGDGDGVAKEHLDGGGGHGGEVERAQLALQGKVDGHVAGRLEFVALNGRDRDEVGTLGPGIRHQAEELLGPAGLGEHDEYVIGPDDADVAVEGVGWGQKDGLGA
eukprot:scaffold5821_cov36-Prasinocladus_malaysianus.AAC.1